MIFPSVVYILINGWVFSFFDEEFKILVGYNIIYIKIRIHNLYFHLGVVK